VVHCTGHATVRNPLNALSASPALNHSSSTLTRQHVFLHNHTVPIGLFIWLC
jgi:hypothetical protein